MTLLDHPIIAQRYFFPRPARVEAPWVVATGGERLVGMRRGAHGGATVLHFHGNGEVVTDWADLAQALDEAGVDAFLGEYRGYGASSGRPALGSMLDDALATFDATEVEPSKMVVYGRSVGSIFALHVAAHRPVGGLVLESGIADVLERLALRMRPEELGADEATLRQAIADKLDHQAKMAMTQCPVLVLHARGDHLVDPSHAERNASWAGDRGELVLYDRGDHNSIFAYNGPQIVQRLVDFAMRATA
ncbi:MAG: alpha/beta fold hydrolase [Myxococcota bacterium]